MILGSISGNLHKAKFLLLFTAEFMPLICLLSVDESITEFMPLICCFLLTFPPLSFSRDRHNFFPKSGVRVFGQIWFCLLNLGFYLWISEILLNLWYTGSTSHFQHWKLFEKKYAVWLQSIQKWWIMFLQYMLEDNHNAGKLLKLRGLMLGRVPTLDTWTTFVSPWGLMSNIVIIDENSNFLMLVGWCGLQCLICRTKLVG